jgi:two-component system response regulator YesN
MCKILIVDDEKLLRQGLIQMTDWNNHGFQIAGEAADGQEALQRIEETLPDVVITDIRMPVLGGVELTKIIKQRYPWIQVIILSSFNDFEYVRETLKLGALDYILKPKLEVNEILQLLKKAQAELDSRSITKQTEDLQTTQMNLIRNIFTNPHFDLKESRRIFDTHQIAFSDENLGIMLFYFEQELPFVTQDTVTSFINVELAPFHSYSSFLDQTSCLTVFNCPPETLPQFKTQGEQLLNRIHANNECNLWGILKVSLPGIRQAVQAYQVMQSAKAFCFYQNKNTIVELVIPQWIPLEMNSPEELEPLLDQHDLEGIYQKISDSILIHIAQKKFFEPYWLKKNLVEVCYYLLHRLTARSVAAAELSQLKFEFLKAIENSSTLEELLHHFKLVLREIKRINDTTKKSRYSPIINQVLSYIGNQYHQEITLSSVATHVHLNKSYLCQLFKEETGQNFNDYLTGIRINKAKELLQSPDYNVYTVCDLVGFSNPSYFGQVFKNLVGMTPSEYGRKFRR